MGHDRDQNGWLGTALRHEPGAAGDACADAETLAAWVDGALDAKAAAAVELHASKCPRCTAVLAAMERSAPVAPARDAWTLARVFRWAVPLTAAATAIAIWVAIPERPITSDLKTLTEEAQTSNAPSVPAPAPIPAPVPGSVQDSRESRTLSPTPEPRTLKRNAAPSTQNQEPRDQIQLRDDARREGFAPEALGAGAAQEAAAAPMAAPQQPAPPPPAAMPAPAAPAPGAPAAAASAADARSARAAPPSVQERSTTSVDAFAETAPSAAQRSALARTAVTNESTSAIDPRFRWRVVASVSIERSTDGGKTWTKTSPLPRENVKGATIASILAGNDVRASVRLSDGTAFFTTNGGMSWLRLQEK